VLESSSSESISGGSGSSLKAGVTFGMYLSPVNVNAPDSLRNSVRVVIPLGVPSSSGRAISLSSFWRLSRWFVYQAHVLRICLRVCRVSPHSHSTFFLGKNCLRNFPMYAWLVRHCTSRK